LSIRIGHCLAYDKTMTFMAKFALKMIQHATLLLEHAYHRRR
jgi:hypothetical protein